MKMNLPNRITLFRIIMIPVFITLFFVNFEGHTVAAMGVFAIASLSDFLDGYIARKRNLVTSFGKFLDPIADKMLVACALIAVCVMPIPVEYENAFRITVAICTMVILSRELMISGFRIIAAGKGIVLAADMVGKVKTCFQMVGLLVLIPVVDIAVWHALTAEIFFYIGFGLIGIATVLTVVSGVHYLVVNKKVLED